MNQTSTPVNQKPENPLINILFNIALPVIILNKLTKTIGPVESLVLALSFPVLYCIYDLITRKKFNFLSLLGFLNTLFTGGLALIGVSGIWFAVKEATFPALIGLFVFASSYTKKPFIKVLLINPTLVDTQKLEATLDEKNRRPEFQNLLKTSTIMLSLSFVVSALLNFFLARHLFTELDPALSEIQRSEVLNEQIAKMTTLSMPIIMIPSMLILILIFWYLFRELKKIIGIDLEELIIKK